MEGTLVKQMTSFLHGRIQTFIASNGLEKVTDFKFSRESRPPKSASNLLFPRGRCERYSL